MSDFRKQATVTDKTVTDAFLQGVTEGLGQQIVWEVEVSFEGQVLNQRRFEDQASALAFAAANCTDAGQTVVILCDYAQRAQGQAALDEGTDDDIVDGEVVEG